MDIQWILGYPTNIRSCINLANLSYYRQPYNSYAADPYLFLMLYIYVPVIPVLFKRSSCFPSEIVRNMPILRNKLYQFALFNLRH
jgi:hypothetical protein